MTDYKKSESAGPYHGPDRRVAERRVAQAAIAPVQEYPKWVDGVLVQNEKEEHAAAKKPAEKKG